MVHLGLDLWFWTVLNKRGEPNIELGLCYVDCIIITKGVVKGRVTMKKSSWLVWTSYSKSSNRGGKLVAAHPAGSDFVTPFPENWRLTSILGWRHFPFCTFTTKEARAGGRRKISNKAEAVWRVKVDTAGEDNEPAICSVDPLTLVCRCRKYVLPQVTWALGWTLPFAAFWG